MKRPFSADDGFVILAYATILIETGLFTWGLFEGSLGNSIYELTFIDMIILAKMVFSSSLVWLVGNVAVKLSVLCLYHRTFTSTRFKRLLYMVMGLTTLYGISFLGAILSRCRPIDGAWNFRPGTSCRDSRVEDVASTILSLCIGLIIILLPIPMLWSLRIEPYKRIALSLVFGIGMITIGVMCWRVIAIEDWVNDTAVDFTSQLPDLALIVMLELCLGVIVTCVPALVPIMDICLKPLISRYWPGMVAGPEHSGDRSQTKYFELEGSHGLSNAGRLYQNTPSVPRH